MTLLFYIVGCWVQPMLYIPESIACANISIPSTGLDSCGPASSRRHSAASCIDDDMDDHIDSNMDDTTEGNLYDGFNFFYWCYNITSDFY